MAFSRLWRKDRVAQGFQKYHHSIRREILHKNGDFQDFVRFHRNWEKRVVPVWGRSLIIRLSSVELFVRLFFPEPPPAPRTRRRRDGTCTPDGQVGWVRRKGSRS